MSFNGRTVSAWTQPSLPTGFTHVSGNPLRYAHDAAGNVHVRGGVNVTTGATGTVLFTLPPELWPSSEVVSIQDCSPTTQAGIRVVVTTAGDVRVDWRAASPAVTVYWLNVVFTTL